MARKQPKEAEKARLKAAIQESGDDLIQRAIRESTQKRLQVKPKPGPAGADELWPGETTELGGFALARAKRKRKRGGNYA